MRRVVLILLIPIFAFSIRIGSYLPESLNEILMDILSRKVGIDVTIEKVTSEEVEYDMILSPFYHPGFKKVEKVFGIIPVVYVKNSGPVVFPLNYISVSSILLSTIDDIPPDVTSVIFPRKTEEIAERFRRMAKKGKLIPMFCEDPKEPTNYAIGIGYNFVGPSYFMSKVPPDYKPVDFSEYFHLPGPYPVFWIRLYHNGSAESNRIISIFVNLKDELVERGLIPVTATGFEGFGFKRTSLRCQDMCQDFATSFSYKLFFTDEDIHKLLREYGNAIEKMIWRYRNSSTTYILTYLFVGTFVLLTVIYKMSGYVRAVKDRRVKLRSSLYILSSHIPLLSIFGFLPFIDFNPSKFLYFFIAIGIAMLDALSGKKRWWLPFSLSFSLLVLGVLNDGILSVADAPFLFAAISFLSEEKSVRWEFSVPGFIAFLTAKRASHIVYLPFSIVLTTALSIYLVYRARTAIKKSRDEDKGIEYSVFIFRTMHPMLSLIVLSLFMAIFVSSYTRFEMLEEDYLYSTMKSALYSAEEVSEVGFPAAYVVPDEKRVSIRINRPEEFSKIRADDRGMVVPKDRGIFFSFVDYSEVIARTFRSSSGYLLVSLVFALTNAAVYSYLSRYGREARMEVMRRIGEKERELGAAARELKEKVEVYEERWRFVQSVIRAFRSSSDFEEFIKGLADSMKGLSFVSEALVARLEDEGWKSVYPEEGRLVKVPVPDMRIDYENRISVSVKTDGEVYAIVSKLSGNSFDLDVFSTAKNAMESFLKSKEELEGFQRLVERLVDEKLGLPGYTESILRVALILGDELGMSRSTVKMATVLHDLGMMFMPDRVLEKEKLNDEDKRIIRKHPIFSEEIASSFSREIASIVRHHHEWWDGSGYPDGLKGEEIPKVSRVIAAADALVAMTRGKEYRPLKSFEEALGEIRRLIGVQFDPEVVKAIFKVEDKLRGILR